jgi:hypothetical protein
VSPMEGTCTESMSNYKWNMWIRAL